MRAYSGLSHRNACKSVSRYTPAPLISRVVACKTSNLDGANLAQRKSDLLQTVGRLNASVVPDPEDIAQLLSYVKALAAENPTADPESSSLIEGRWVLLYSSNAPGAAAAGQLPGSQQDPVQQQLLAAISPFQAVSDSLYKVFYNYVPILAGSATGRRGSVALPSQRASTSSGDEQGSSTMLVRSRGNFQTFDIAGGRVTNEARLEILGTKANITVTGTAEVVPAASGSSTASSGGRKRLKAMFTSFSIALDGNTILTLPLAVPNLLAGGALAGPVGYVETCYLDEQLRISTGDKGSLFITIRDSSDE